MASLRCRLPLVFIWILLLITAIMAAGLKAVEATDADGNQYLVADNRRPSLYTQNFGDCLGSSSINVTRFDAAYYQDNMTVLFHLEGNTNVANDSLMSTPSFTTLNVKANTCQCTSGFMRTASLGSISSSTPAVPRSTVYVR